MNVKELKHYGKDILSITEHSKMPVRLKFGLLTAALVYLKSVIKVLGIRGMFKLLKEVKEEIRKAEKLDWHKLCEKGISEKNLAEIIKKMALAKVMAEKVGMEKAAQLRNRLSHRISIPVFEEMFAPAAVFIECGDGDFLPAFKQYYMAMMEAMAQKGLEEATVTEDTEDVFQLNVTYCAWVEAARILGNPQYCYASTCYGDEVFFPVLCAKAGFEFERKSTMALGAPVCDFRFTRKK